MERYKKLFEAKQVGIIYHFTSYEGIQNIIKDNYILKTNRTYISFTRNYQLQKHFQFSNRIFRIVIDGNKLSNKYKIEPFSNIEAVIPEEQEERIVKNSVDIKNSIISIELYKPYLNIFDTKLENEILKFCNKNGIKIVNKWELIK